MNEENNFTGVLCLYGSGVSFFRILQPRERKDHRCVLGPFGGGIKKGRHGWLWRPPLVRSRKALEAFHIGVVDGFGDGEDFLLELLASELLLEGGESLATDGVNLAVDTDCLLHFSGGVLAGLHIVEAVGDSGDGRHNAFELLDFLAEDVLLVVVLVHTSGGGVHRDSLANLEPSRTVVPVFDKGDDPAVHTHIQKSLESCLNLRLLLLVEVGVLLPVAAGVLDCGVDDCLRIGHLVSNVGNVLDFLIAGALLDGLL